MKGLLPFACLAAALAPAACDPHPYRKAVVETRRPGTAARAPGEAPSARALRFSVASIESPRDTFAAYTRLFERVGQMLEVAVEFEQRRTYREVNDLLISGRLDMALLCTGGYLDLERRAPGAVDVVAVPVRGGDGSYRALVVVPASREARDLGDLRGARFAFTDELSFSGRLYVQHLLRERKLDPERYFDSTTYTGSHDRSILAVASGLVDGAAVHGGILAQMEERDPSLAQRLRIIHRSPPLGGMPVVVSRRLPASVRVRLQEVLLRLDRDPEGAASLRLLRFDRFAEPAAGLQATALKMLDGR